MSAKTKPIETLDFWTWMGTLPDGLETIIIITAVVLLFFMVVGTGLLIYYFVKYKKFKVEYGKLKIDTNNPETPKPEEPKIEKTPTVQVINKTDIMILLTKSFEVSNYEITTMKLETIRDQMDYADNKVSHLISRMESSFIAKLKTLPEIGDCDITKTNDYVSYRAILGLLKARLMDIFRSFCRENHFAELTEIEFDNYADIKARTLLNEGTTFLNDIYFPDLRISRDELYHLNSPSIENFMNIGKDIMKNARKVAIKNNELLRSKKMELAALLESFVGKDNVMLDIWKKQHKLI